MKYFIIILLFLLTGCNRPLGGISADLQLKTAKSNILFYREVNELTPTGTKKSILYAWDSGVKAEAETYGKAVEDLTQRTENTQFFKRGEDRGGENWTVKATSIQRFIKSGNTWHKMAYATTTPEAWQAQISLRERIFGQSAEAIATSTYGGAGGDGSIALEDANWDTAHDAAAGGGIDDGTRLYMMTRKKAAGNFVIERGFSDFFTAALDDTAIISSSSVHIYPDSVVDNDNDGKDFVTMIQSTQADPTLLSVNDYNDCGATNNPTEIIDTTERKDLTNMTADEPFSFLANTQTYISLTGWTKVCFREGHDTLDEPYAVAGGYNQVYYNGAIDTVFPPFLLIDYTLPAAKVSIPKPEIWWDE